MTTTTTDSVYGKAYGGSAPENYQRYFVPVIPGPFAEDLLAEAALHPGERVLDVACGTGVVARLAAERVGPSGTVAALDLNPAMLSVARSVPATGAAIRGERNQRRIDPAAGRRVRRRVVSAGTPVHGGQERRTARNAPRADARRPRARDHAAAECVFDALDEAMTRHVGSDAGAFVRMVFSLDDPAIIERLFHDAGFADVNVRTYAKEVRLPAARDFLWQEQCTAHHSAACSRASMAPGPPPSSVTSSTAGRRGRTLVASSTSNA